MAASMDRRNKRIDADILQSRADILRAGGIIPPDNKEPRQEPKEKPAESVGARQEKAEIPKFDLAEDIMAEQRKITATRRMAPGQKNETQDREPQAGLIDYTLEQPRPALSQPEQIIAEIVARDIERLRWGG